MRAEPRRAARLLLGAALAVAAAASAAAALKNPDTLVYATPIDFDGFDPAWAEDMSPLYNVYESLLAFRGAGVSTADLVPLLSAKVPSRANGLISADGLTYRFPIRKGVKFSNGEPLTAEDARYSFLRFLLLDRAGGPSESLLSPILGTPTTRPGGKLMGDAYARAAAAVTVEGDDLVVRLHRPFAPFLGVVTNLGRIVSKKWAVEHGQWDGGAATWKRYNDLSRHDALPDSESDGTGPFKVERYDAATGDIVLVRNDGYWRGPARLKRVYIKKVPEFLTRKLMLEAGDADVIAAMPADAPKMKGIAGVVVVPGLRKIQISKALRFAFKVDADGNPNLGSGKLDGAGIPTDFFSDADARKGFAAAIDADAYIRDVYRGAGARLDGLIPPGLVGARTGPPKDDFDLKRAARHFRRAWGGRVWEKGFIVPLLYETGSDDEPLCRMIKKEVESLNPKFHLDLRPVSYSSLTAQRAQGKVPLLLAGWTADYPDADQFASLLRSGASAAVSGYSNPEADRLIAAGAAAATDAARAAIYSQLQKIADRDVPFVPIATVLHSRVSRAWVKGYVFNPAAHNQPYDSFYYDLYKAE